MRILKLTRIFILMSAVMLCASCKKDSDPAGGGEEPAGEALLLGDGSNAFEIKSNLTLSYPNTYILSGFVYVTDGVTLTVEPGVVVRGDRTSKGTLIIERGGKIVAEGTAGRPIVFTSNQAPGKRNPGDWGGLIILGKAPNNVGEQTIEGGVRSKHGGSDPHDNSGILKYVRVEFAGIEYSTDNEINGITFGSTGDATVVDYVQVSYSGDDSYEWFGGTVNARHLIAYHGWDDDFDTDNGFSGKVQFALSVRNPQIGDKSASNSFESDNNAGGSDASPVTGAVFANVSIFGPVATPSTYTDRAGEKGSDVNARFQAAFHLRRNTSLSVFNSLAASFPVGAIIEGAASQSLANSGALNVANTVFAGHIRNFQDKQYWSNGAVLDPETTDVTETYIMRANGGNRTFASLAEIKLHGSYFPASDSPLATGADWTNAKVSSWFEKVAYRGAFAPAENSGSNWTAGWTDFDPQNTVY
ncbi:MAG: hypothetical protein LBH60_02430 [Prevotellaceae bacterium]|jgi:hypothetical protein|nr:hypothetical protein [Prevotellaceae bacterium]